MVTTTYNLHNTNMIDQDMIDAANEIEERDAIDEVLDEANLKAREKSQENLPEAPASANTRVQLPSGRQYQITMRSSSMKDLVEQITFMEDYFDSHNWLVPQWQQKDGGGQKQQSYLEKDCPKCDDKIRLMTVKKDGPNKGKEFWGCKNKSCGHFAWA